MFNSIIELEDHDLVSFNIRVESLRSKSEPFDMFMDYYNRKQKSKHARLTCLNEDDLEPTSPEEVGPPIAKSYIPYPDLVEVYLAEIMLGRELTPNEKDGSRAIHKISEEGVHFFAPLTWVTFPHAYISIKDMEDKTDYDAEPLPKIFDIEEIRGKYSGRDGGLIDD